MPSQPTEPTVVDSNRDIPATENAKEADVVEIAEYRRSRYERNGRSLPHLGDDPDWTPPTFERPKPISDEGPQRWFDRLRR